MKWGEASAVPHVTWGPHLEEELGHARVPVDHGQVQGRLPVLVLRLQTVIPGVDHLLEDSKVTCERHSFTQFFSDKESMSSHTKK